MKNRILVILIFIFLNRTSVSFSADNAVDPREAAIDRAIGGMEEGSRPLGSQNDAEKNQGHPVSGSSLSPAMDTRTTASADSQNSSVANLSANENIGTPTGGPTESTDGSTEPITEPSGGEGTGGSIVDVDANVDLSGGSPAVDANLDIDTNADSLLEADTSVTTDTVSTDVTATESGAVGDQDLTTTVNEAPVDAILDAEVVTTDVPAESEVTAGLEADVDPVTADSDVASTDPADGLSAGL